MLTCLLGVYRGIYACLWDLEGEACLLAEMMTARQLGSRVSAGFWLRAVEAGLHFLVLQWHGHLLLVDFVVQRLDLDLVGFEFDEVVLKTRVAGSLHLHHRLLEGAVKESDFFQLTTR